MGVAVDVCLRPGVPKFVEAAVVLDVQLTRGDIGGRERLAVLVEYASEPLGDVVVPYPGRPQPGGDRCAHSGILESGMEVGEVLESARGRVRRDAPPPVGERATGGDEVFEEQHEVAVVGGCRPVRAGHP